MIFIVAILSTVALYFGFTSRAFARTSQLENMVQTNLIIKDLKSGLLKELSSVAKTTATDLCATADDKSSCESDTLRAILDSFYGLPLSFSIGTKEAVLSCLPAQTKIDINTLKVADQTRDEKVHFRRKMVERYLQDEYKLYASWQFFELLDFVFDENGTKFGYLKNDDRLNVADDSFALGAINSYRSLQKIASDYATITSDKSALNVPFDELFVFESARNRLDFDHLDQKACDIIFGKASPVCDLVGKKATFDDVISLSSDANLSIYNFLVDFGYNPILDCKASFRSRDKSESYSFVFDIDRGELDSFKISN